jgi:hypothetical protein
VVHFADNRADSAAPIVDATEIKFFSGMNKIGARMFLYSIRTKTAGR